MNRNYSISDETVVKRVQAAVELELAKRKAMDVPLFGMIGVPIRFTKKIAMEQWKKQGLVLEKDVIVNNSKKKPEIVVFAGPNGSGKSTITELLKPPIDYINADEIKKNLKCSDLEAAQLAESKDNNMFNLCLSLPLKQFYLLQEI